jgi:membrane protein YqaA with SNARE-associated domain
VTTGAAVEPVRREIFLLVGRWVVGLGVLVVVMAMLARLFRDPLEAMGAAFVEAFGLSGMLLGTFLADGFHCPVPPQFYMVMAVSSGVSAVGAFVAITLGSLLGGFAGFRVAGRLAHLEFVSRRLARMQVVVERAFARYGSRSAVVATLLPVPYSVICYLAGLNGLPTRFFVVFALCRVPRLLVFFYLVRLGWSVG